MPASEIASVSSEFDIFAHTAVQTSVLWTIETAYKPIAIVNQNGLEFFYLPTTIPTLILISNYVRDKVVSGSGKDLDFTGYTAVSIYFFHCLFSKCKFTINGFTITQASEHCN